MPKRRELLAAALGATSMGGLGLLAGCKGHNMQEIKFDLGKNIVETAKASGVPKFDADNVNGNISYSINSIPKEIPARFARPGYEIVWQPIYAFRMSTDSKRDPGLGVESVALSLDTFLKTHEQAQAFFEQTFTQFQKGKWTRYFYELESGAARVMGRSSYLDEAGQLDSDATGSLDPAYKMPAADWRSIAAKSPTWAWEGDGILAKLNIKYTDGDALGLRYTADLDFELLDVYHKRMKERIAEDNKRGDAKGWNSTAKYEAGIKEEKERYKRLEAAAIKRGDSVVPKP